MPSKPNPTIIDVARLAGLSKSTVSRVIRGEQGNVSDSARQKVLDAIRVLGYEQNAVASSMRTAQTFTIMLAIPDITNPFWPEVARGLQDVMDREGYAVVFANSDWDGQRELGFLRLARRNRFDGIVINPVGVSNADILAVQIPAVLIGLRSDFPDFDIVGSDSYGATLQALDYLHSLGHQRIGILLGIHNDRPSQARLDGYLAFLQKTGLPYEPGLVLNVPFEHDGGFQGMQQLLGQAVPPSAVLAGNDTIAIGAMHAASGAGLHIPEDISIMGIDDIYAAAASIPPLTTVAKQKYEIGCQAGNLLLERIRGGFTGAARRRVIPCQLIERATTASVWVPQP